jgi:hypothetical protein
MNPYVIIIGNQELIVNIVANNLDRIIFNNPLQITYPKDKEIILNAPTWLRCTHDRDFSIEKSKVVMILNPTKNLKTSYIDIVTKLHKAQQDLKESIEKSKEAPNDTPKKEETK